MGIIKLSGGGSYTIPLLRGQSALPQPAYANRGVERKQTLGQLVSGHFKREKSNFFAGSGGVSGEIENKAGLAHAGARPHNYKVGFVKPADHGVNIGKSGGNSGQLFAFFGIVEGGEMLKSLGSQNIFYHNKVGVFLSFSDVIKLLLGGVKLKLGRPGSFGGGGNDLPSHLYKRANEKFFINHLSVGTHICHRRHQLGKLGEIFLPAGLLIVSGGTEFFENGDKIHGFVELGHGKKGAENSLVLGKIKMLGLKLGHLFVVHTVGVEEHGAQHRLL